MLTATEVRALAPIAAELVACQAILATAARVGDSPEMRCDCAS